MLKEIVISIIIVIMILVGNYITKEYTEESVKEMVGLFDNVRNEIKKSNLDIESEKIETAISKISEKWKERHEKLAYFIEHDELEKIDTNLTALDGSIEYKEYGDAVSQLDQSIFLLKHIEDKYAFNLKNIF